jgi:hypothetical protein
LLTDRGAPAQALVVARIAVVAPLLPALPDGFPGPLALLRAHIRSFTG